MCIYINLVPHILNVSYVDFELYSFSLYNSWLYILPVSEDLVFLITCDLINIMYIIFSFQC